MTNKINGIDVSECPLFDKKTGCYHTFNGECVKDSCSLYKWLLEYKRLQEENEELKKANNLKNELLSDLGCPTVATAKRLQFTLKEQIKNLQKENENLKKRQITKNGFICDCEQNAKYKQALENIRTYIKQECKNKQCPQTCANCFIGNILIKVNEVLNDRD